MDLHELAQELIYFLESTGQYDNFLDWESERGYDRDDLSDEMEKIQDS